MTETETGIAITAAAQDAARRTYAVSVSPDRVRAAEAATTERYARQLKVQGFRKGKAPPAVVRRRFGDAIRQAVIEELLRASWEAAREQDGLKPIADPQVRNVKFEDGAPLTFELLVDVKPEIALERPGRLPAAAPRGRGDRRDGRGPDHHAARAARPVGARGRPAPSPATWSRPRSPISTLRRRAARRRRTSRSASSSARDGRCPSSSPG